MTEIHWLSCYDYLFESFYLTREFYTREDISLHRTREAADAYRVFQRMSDKIHLILRVSLSHIILEKHRPVPRKTRQLCQARHQLFVLER